MVKRILSASTSDFEKMDRSDLLESIRLSEGRTVCAEVVSGSVPLVYGVTNAETAAAFGADLISLNGYDVQRPMIMEAPGGEQSFHSLQDGGDSLSHTDAHGRETIAFLLNMEFVSQRGDNSRSGRAQWVAERDCSPVDVHRRRIHTDFSNAGDCLRCERLIQLG